jgi:hypothetical protein
MHSTKEKLAALLLDTENCIVIGSGILEVLKIRMSNDIDAVVTQQTFMRLSENPQLSKHDKSLTCDGIEIFDNWAMTATKKIYTFEDLFANSIIIEGVRYITLEFLYEIKKLWVATDKVPRAKDINDVRLISAYLEKALITKT